MISWKFYTQRTGKSLKAILKDARSLDEAKKVFDRLDLTHPSDLEIHTILDKLILDDKKKAEKLKEEKTTRPKKTTPRRSRKKSTAKTSGTAKTSPLKIPPVSEELEDAEIIDKTQENSKNEKYFRRVVLPKKSRS